MRWLLIGLLVSLAVLLVAVGAVTWHIYVKRAERPAQSAKALGSNLDSELDADHNPEL